MKNLVFIMILLAASLAVKADASADYTGDWSLDLKQSKNLPTFYANVKSHKLSITKDEKQLNVAVEIDAGQNSPDKFNFAYNLNGTDSQTETLIRTPNGLTKVPTTLKAVAGEGGKLKITITREVKFSGDPFKAVTTEDWELSADGKTLTIHRTDEMPNREIRSDMVFVKD